MRQNKFLAKLVLVMTLLGTFFGVAAQRHDFAEHAKVSPASLDQQPSKNFQTATFGLG